MTCIEVEYACYECGFKGYLIPFQYRKLKCPQCQTINDYWLDTESPPLNHK